MHRITRNLIHPEAEIRSWTQKGFSMIRRNAGKINLAIHFLL
ncbi:hypothetical protein B4135_1425 [Caldibacillus debilis]|uniref:Uncharacterized protein n=1 Tax=Caldibacillus debilis TaxID=301148 RepID=A0A150MC04_9BACI|nr:hypothetical protein B4135_1425 [Caldibacillus debilis]